MKYRIELTTAKDGTHWRLYDGLYAIATFHNHVHGIQDSAKTNAQKVCDLLNETSRSQGKHT